MTDSQRRRGAAWRGWVLLLGGIGLVAGLGRPGARPQAPHVATGTRYMVAADHPLASQAGASILARGGNAVDAAVAAALAICVCRPESATLGGGGFLLWKPPGRPAVVIDARETAPAGTDPARYLEAGRPVPARTRTGPLAVGVPGLLAGLWRAHDEHGSGRISWAEVIAPARTLSERGFPVDRHLAESLRELPARLASAEGPAWLYEETRTTFLPGGRPPRRGAVLRQPALARSLAVLAKDPGALYRGPLAAGIAGTLELAGGTLRRSDLAAYRAVLREPLRARALGAALYTMPPPSSGGAVVLQILGVLERLGGAAAFDGPWDPRFVHATIEAMRHGFADRARWLGDPDDPVTGPAVRRAVETMLDPKTIRRIAAASEAGPRARDAYGHTALPEDGGTSHLSVVDEDGGACAITLTINLPFGSLITVRGIVLNDELDDFTIAPGVPNAYGLLQSERNRIAPGRRPLSSMCPLIATDPEGRVTLVAGASGGPRIITATLHTAVRTLGFRMPLAEAVQAPRFHAQWVPEEVWVERGFPPALEAALRRRGHRLAPYPRSAGHTQAVAVRYRGGRREITGVSSPRKGGAPAGR